MTKKHVLWCMNVYTRGNHLRVQQELVREHFGSSELDIFVFSNHETIGKDVLSYKEDFFHQHPVNAGWHTGVRDAYNQAVDIAQDYDVVVWTHADCIFDDYSVVREIIDRFWRDGHVFACLAEDRAGNPRRRDDGEGPHVFNDFFLIRGDYYGRVFPQTEELDLKRADGSANNCVETALGNWVWGAKSLSETTWTIPTKLTHDHFAEILGRGKACRSNVFSKTVEFLKKTPRWSVVELSKIMDRLMDDKRKDR